MDAVALRDSKLAYRKRLAFMLICLLQLFDFMSTRSAMALHEVVELNPLMRGASGQADMLKVVAAKLLVCALAYVLIRRTQRLRLVWVACGLYGLIVLSNWLLLP